MFIFCTGALVIICSQHLCLGAVRLAYRCEFNIERQGIMKNFSFTDKGICLPTIILWMLFVYLEAGIRWKDSRHIPHLDLCRPFAAHW